MYASKKTAAAVAAMIGIGAVALGGATLQPAHAQTPPPRARILRSNRAQGERHPEIRRALRNLEQAKNNLQHGARDFSGHREQALDLTQKAIAQCEQALQADRR